MKGVDAVGRKITKHHHYVMALIAAVYEKKLVIKKMSN